MFFYDTHAKHFYILHSHFISHTYVFISYCQIHLIQVIFSLFISYTILYYYNIFLRLSIAQINSFQMREKLNTYETMSGRKHGPLHITTINKSFCLFKC